MSDFAQDLLSFMSVSLFVATVGLVGTRGSGRGGVGPDAACWFEWGWPDRLGPNS